MFYCEICWVKFANQHEIVSHFRSNAHSTASNFKPHDGMIFFCSICSICTTGQEGLDQHNTSNKHNSRVSVKANRHLYKSITAEQALSKEGTSDLGLVRSFTDSQINVKHNGHGFLRNENSDNLNAKSNINDSLGSFLDMKLKNCGRRSSLKSKIDSGILNLNGSCYGFMELDLIDIFIFVYFSNIELLEKIGSLSNNDLKENANESQSKKESLKLSKPVLLNDSKHVNFEKENLKEDKQLVAKSQVDLDTGVFKCVNACYRVLEEAGIEFYQHSSDCSKWDRSEENENNNRYLNDMTALQGCLEKCFEELELPNSVWIT